MQEGFKNILKVLGVIGLLVLAVIAISYSDDNRKTRLVTGVVVKDIK